MTLINLHKLTKTYTGKNGENIYALVDVSLSIQKGEVIGIVGESGCGKSTLGRTLLRLIEPTNGEVFFEDKDLINLNKREMKAVRKDLQIIFQDPFGSLNPRHKVASIIGEPLVVHRVGNRQSQKQRVLELLELVGLPLDAGNSYPHEFSGGQRQRIAIARALALEPKLLVADEAVSALDVSVQSQIINLIADLRKKLNLSILFISHDLSVIRHVSDRVGVMYLGRIVEIGATEDIMNSPQHPYTKALLTAIPHVGKKRQQRIILEGELPDPARPPAGCAFHSRCSSVMDICRTKRPELGHQNGEQSIQSEVACHLY